MLGIKGMTMQFWLVLFSISCFANTLGLNISSAFNSAVTIYILIPLLIIPQLILSGIVVNFDKLNPQISSIDQVPLIGEMMASRWGYEALVVTQFKNNAYTKNFFEFDKSLANSEFKSIYYIPTITGAVDFVNTNYRNKDPQKQEEVKAKLKLIRNEIQNQMIAHNVPADRFPHMDQLYPEKFNKDVADACKVFLKTVKTIYNNKLKKATRAKELLQRELTNTPEKNQQLIELRNNNENESIIFFLKNSATDERLIENDGKLIQKMYPIYQDPVPEHALDFRTHFYAPSKHFAGSYFETLSFNVMIIWVMSFILFITLYFDFLRKLVNGIGK